MNERVNAILDFWFNKSSPKDYFQRNVDFDKLIKDLFNNDYNKAINNELEDWQDNHESCLALIILLDQFSRNLYRDNPLAFAQDNKTRLIVNEAINRGDLKNLDDSKKLFLLLPLIHSENISDHIFAHTLYETYLTNHPYKKDIKKIWEEHTNVIKKFGRYPHRNKVLKRSSTDQEEAFLLKTNSSWQKN